MIVEVTGSDPAGLIGLEKVALLLDTSLRTVQRLVAAGELPPPILIGRSPKLEIQEVRTYIERQKHRCRSNQKEDLNKPISVRHPDKDCRTSDSRHSTR